LATALFAALIALTQTDIKKVLAYSTVSHWVNMFLGLGVGAYTGAFFHVLNMPSSKHYCSWAQVGDPRYEWRAGHAPKWVA